MPPSLETRHQELELRLGRGSTVLVPIGVLDEDGDPFDLVAAGVELECVLYRWGTGETVLTVPIDDTDAAMGEVVATFGASAVLALTADRLRWRLRDVAHDSDWLAGFVRLTPIGRPVNPTGELTVNLSSAPLTVVINAAVNGGSVSEEVVGPIVEAYLTGAFPAQGLALLDGSTPAAQRSTLALGSAAVANVGTADGEIPTNVAAAGKFAAGPASSQNDRIAVFNGTTGKQLKDGAVTIAGLLSGATPAALAAAAAVGTATTMSRGDHAHQRPTAGEVPLSLPGYTGTTVAAILAEMAEQLAGPVVIPPTDPPDPPTVPVVESSTSAFTTSLLNTGVTVTKPTGLATGDVLILVAAASVDVGGTITWTPPAGTTLVGSLGLSAGVLHHAAWCKPITNGGAEPSSYTVSASISSTETDFQFSCVALRVSGADAALITGEFEATNSTTTGIHTVHATTAGAGALVLLTAAGARDGAYTNPVGYTTVASTVTTGGGASSTENRLTTATDATTSAGSVVPGSFTYSLTNRPGVTGAIVIPAALSVGNGLEWPRPDTTGYTTVVVPANGRLTGLNTAVNYIVDIKTNGPLPRLILSGGRDLVIIGGEISVDAEPLNYGQGTAWSGAIDVLGKTNLAFKVDNFAGHLYVEGVDIGGEFLYEGCNVNTSGTYADAKCTMQRIRVSDPVLAYRPDRVTNPTYPLLVNGATQGAASHEGGDVFQSYNIPRAGMYFADWTVCGATYQGWYIQALDNRVAPDVEFRRIEIQHVDPDRWQSGGDLHTLIGTSPTGPYGDIRRFSHSGTFKVVLSNQDGFQAVGDAVVEDCYLTWPTEYQTSVFPWDGSISTAGTHSYSQMIMTTNGVSGTMTWLGANAAGSALVQGSPSGEFVPAGSVGLGYTG